MCVCVYLTTQPHCLTLISKTFQVPTFVSFDGDDAVERFSGADPNRLETMVQELEKR